MQRLPLAGSYYRHYLPLFPMAIEQFDLDPYDLVISSSHCAAKAVVPSGRARHLCYCHSPMRYAWDQFDAYFGPARTGQLASRWVYKPCWRGWHDGMRRRRHAFIALWRNSEHVAGRSADTITAWRRSCIHRLTRSSSPADVDLGSHFLIVSALVPYKRIELAIAACDRVGATLRIVGDGPDRGRLEARAGRNVEFLGRLGDEAVRDEYRRALAVVLPGEEDFGIVPVEAQACGRPVVALGRGGALYTVIDGENGVLFAEPDAGSLAEALERVARQSFDSARISRPLSAVFTRSPYAADAGGDRRDDRRARRHPMVRRYNRLLVVFYVLTDSVLAMWAFVLAYGIRFESGLIPVPRGYPPIEQYLNVLPFIAVLVPLAFQLQGVYRLRRGRSRVDDFFAVLIGSILAVVLGVISTLYVQAYYASEEAKARGAYEVSQLVWTLYSWPQRRIYLRFTRSGTGATGTPLARRNRPEACPDRGRRRSWANGGRPHPTAP